MLADQLPEKIRSWARELGFQQVGITDIETGQHADRLQQWLDNQYHGSMQWMTRYADLRKNPGKLHAGSLRVISVRMDYLPEADKNLIAKVNAKGDAYIARYTLGRDYHKLMRKRLAELANRINASLPESETPHQRAFVDSAPILERAFAEKAGLGWIGKNTMLINATAGSYFFLGEILTDIPLPTDTPQATAHCGTCTACLDLCPTRAFVAPYELDARRCISYLTIENRGDIPEDLRPLLGNRIFGCDDCQAVCPWNKFAQPTREGDFLPRHGLDEAQLVELFLWSEDVWLQKTEGSALRRIGYAGWLRNIAVALGNAETRPDIIDALQRRAMDASMMVREHVSWALSQHVLPSR
ncbi:MAG TPA: tRNA epoxyqueuosine(34) reductase QueG [Pseudomonadales bacterium]|nr:tRNA epoxyqueuosine(34) reductase QueG [Pseudomonadales bacterium]